MREQQKEDGGIWYTFCPNEIKSVLDIELYSIFGKDFAVGYKKCINAYKSGKLKNVGKYNARELVKLLMRVQFESGLPYISFLDEMNKHNTNKHVGTIPCFNLCLTGDTKIKIFNDITEELKEISLKNYIVNYHNDEINWKVWSYNTESNTGEWQIITDGFLSRKNSKIIKVIDDETGKFIKCTEDHKIFTINRGYIKAKNLKENDELILF